MKAARDSWKVIVYSLVLSALLATAPAKAFEPAGASPKVEPQASGTALDAWARDRGLINLGARVRIGGDRVIGREQPEAFREVDLSANLRLPWSDYGASGWGWGTRLFASIGAMKGQRDWALVGTLMPVLAWGTRDGRYAIDAGFGTAVLSRQRFAQQDFGGLAQFALTVGIGVPIAGRLGIGYRYVHYSDAGLYGDDTIGADFQMVEVTYRF